MTVLDKMPARRQGLAVPPATAHAAGTDRADIAAQDAVSGTAANDDSVGAQLLERAAGQQHVAPAGDHRAFGSPHLEDQAPQRDVRTSCKVTNGVANSGKSTRRPAQVRRGQQIQPAGSAIQVPLAGLIQFLEHVQEIERIA